MSFEEIIINSIPIILTVLGASWLLGRRMGSLEGIVSGVKDRMGDFHDRLSSLEGKRTDALVNASPVGLTEKGNRILEESGMKDFIDSNRDSLLESACSRKFDNAYDVQQHIFEFFDQYEFGNEISKNLKQTAFEEGISMHLVRRIGAVYFREICLGHLGMNSEDIDKPR